jgi:hypothetical protein
MLFYEVRQERLGNDYFDRVSETIEFIARDRQTYPVYAVKRLSRVFRRAAVDRFPSIVVYQIRPDETLIVAVAHASQQPDYWQDRNAP